MRRQVEVNHLWLAWITTVEGFFESLGFMIEKLELEFIFSSEISSMMVDKPLKPSEPFPLPCTRNMSIKHKYLKGIRQYIRKGDL